MPEEAKTLEPEEEEGAADGAAAGGLGSEGSEAKEEQQEEQQDGEQEEQEEEEQDAEQLPELSAFAGLHRLARVVSDAHLQTMLQARPGLMECQLESFFVRACHYGGGCRPSIARGEPLAASGPNTAVPDYVTAPKDRRLEDGDLVICDMGAEFLGKSVAITNAFPASGRFTPEQRLVFEVVLAMEEAAFAVMGPKVAWAKLQAASRQAMCEQLRAAGVLVGSTEVALAAGVDRVLAPHGLEGPLGPAAAAAAGFVEEGQLEPGTVVSIQPGVYFRPDALEAARQDSKLSGFFDWKRLAAFEHLGGVRLSDAVVITEASAELLTIAPRSAEEVEATMRGEVRSALGLLEFRRERASELASEREYAAS